MRYSETRAAETREKVVKEAAAQIRKHGPDGVSVAKVMAAAGLTHGGFYAHFKSKDDLVVGALQSMFEQSRRRFAVVTDGLTGPAALAAFIDFYVTTTHRDHPERGCAIAVLNGDLARLEGTARDTYDAGFAAMVARIGKLLPAEIAGDREALALSMVSEMVGAVALSRALGDTAASIRLLDATRAAVKARAGLKDL
ncbi:hypothetical protein sos41_43450 [Alphaproteobacteria bacterium SO-S41]|nr:hypothetical protein sos41_43450 [Alphaproteobacteria bacterium SO-S41]